ncbi:hypothetical protein C8R44DRAFT_725933 [Mycena epipterygia]|nr:hypothetical protein C8R44DRAFT_725933 [Mycena epipterygia]
MSNRETERSEPRPRAESIRSGGLGSDVAEHCIAEIMQQPRTLTKLQLPGPSKFSSPERTWRGGAEAELLHWVNFQRDQHRDWRCAGSFLWREFGYEPQGRQDEVDRDAQIARGHTDTASGSGGQNQNNKIQTTLRGGFKSKDESSKQNEKGAFACESPLTIFVLGGRAHVRVRVHEETRVCTAPWTVNLVNRVSEGSWKGERARRMAPKTVVETTQQKAGPAAYRDETRRRMQGAAD